MASKETAPKEKVLTEEQFATLERIASKILDVRCDLERLRGEDDISTIMFDVGAASYTINSCQDELETIIDSFQEHTDEDF